MDIRKTPTDRFSISTDSNHILHKIGSNKFPEMRQICVGPEDVGGYEEVEVAKVPQTEIRAEIYKYYLVELIRQRYDLDDEIALAANRDDGDLAHSAEWVEYQAYRAECKIRARKLAVNYGTEKQYSINNSY